MCDLDINPHCTTCLCDAQRNSPLGSESLFKPGPAVITHIQWRVLAWCDWAIHRESGAKVSGPWLSAVKESNAPPTLRKCSNCADKGREMVHLILSISRSCCIMLFVFAGSEECSDCLQGDRVTSSFRSLFDQQHEQRTWTPPRSPRVAEGRSMSTHECCTLSRRDWLLSPQPTVVYLCFLCGASLGLLEIPGKITTNFQKNVNEVLV